jgi:hypothetical protein
MNKKLAKQEDKNRGNRVSHRLGASHKTAHQDKINLGGHENRVALCFTD